MGADLYINAVYQPHYKKWNPRFERAARLRDQTAPDSEERRQAQAKVETLYDKLHEAGYFRDSYNPSNLLWNFGLSWWTDVIPMLDQDGDLSVAESRRLLALLKQRHSVFEQKLAELSDEERKYFLDRYAELQKFLTQAIELGAPIHASL